jgi:hypothetical protein
LGLGFVSQLAMLEVHTHSLFLLANALCIEDELHRRKDLPIAEGGVRSVHLQVVSRIESNLKVVQGLACDLSYGVEVSKVTVE